MEHIINTTGFHMTDTAVTLGKFDGLHLGHQLLLRELAAQKVNNLRTILFTFFCNPKNLFSEEELSFINTPEENRFYLESGRIPVPAPDIMVAYPFTKETAAMSPESFIKEVLVEKLGAKVIIVGTDFRFGNRRSGDVRLLKAYQKKYGYTLIVKEKLSVSYSLLDAGEAVPNCINRKETPLSGMERMDTPKTEIISSTTIRLYLTNGTIERANQMLGYSYTLRGEIVHGKNLGHKYLLPTINLKIPAGKLLPPNGVYYSVTKLAGNTYFGVTNLGYKPTVGGETTCGAETYLFDFADDAYGQTAEVSLVHFKRPEQTFASFEKLREQIFEDVQAAKEYFHIVPV